MPPRQWKATAKAEQREIALLIANPKSASQSRTPPLRKILVSTIPRRNTLVPVAMIAMIAADKILAATAVAIAGDAGVGAVGAAAVDAHKAAEIFLHQSMPLHKGSSARTIPAVRTTRAASKVAVSNHATSASPKALFSSSDPQP